MDIFLGLALAPVVLILWYIYKKDKHKEPAGQLAKTFGIGVLSAIPVIIVEIVTYFIFPTEGDNDIPLIMLFFNTLIGIALVEEFFKWIVVRICNYNNKHFDETYDAIVYCVFSSLGFAAFENIMYVCLDAIVSGAFSGLLTGIMRLIVAVPGHAFYGVFMGIFLAKAKTAQVQKKHSLELGYMLLSIIIPTLLHGLYDFFLISENGFLMLVWFVLVVIMYIFAIILVRKASRTSVHYENNIQ